MFGPSKSTLKDAIHKLANKFGLEAHLVSGYVRFGVSDEDYVPVPAYQHRKLKEQLTDKIEAQGKLITKLTDDLRRFERLFDNDINGLHAYLGVDWNTNVAGESPHLVKLESAPEAADGKE